MAFFRGVSLRQLRDAFGALNPAWIIMGLAMLAADYALRCWRWTAMLRLGNAQVRFSEVVPPFMASIALNNVLPFRAGDVTRALVFPARLGIGRAFAAATLVLERLLDLVFVLLLMAWGLFAARRALGGSNFIRDMATAGGGLALLAVIGVAGAILLAPRLQAWLNGSAARRSAGAGKALRAGADLFGTIGALRSLPMWAAVLPASALIWAFEAGVFWAVLVGFGVPDAGGTAALLGSTGTLATLVPSTPGYIGTFHLAVQQAAALVGLPSALGSSVAILCHAVLWVGTTLFGLACLFRLGTGSKPLTPPSIEQALP